MRAIFLTRVTSTTVGGLGGVIAQMYKTVHSLTVVGPPGTRHFVASLRGFIRRVFGFSLIEYQPNVRQGEKLDTIYEDENITVSAFPIIPIPTTDKPSQEQVENTHYSRVKTHLELTTDEVRRAAIYYMFSYNSANTQSDFLEGEVIVDDSERWTRNRLHENQLPPFLFPNTYPRSSTLAYVVIGPRPECPTADSLSDRNTRPRPVVIILDVPSPGLVPSLLHSFREKYARFLNPGPESTAEYKIKAVYHMLGQRVTKMPSYMQFIRSFPEHTRHFISCPELSPDILTFPCNAWRLYQLSQLDPEMFPDLRRRIPNASADMPCLPSEQVELMRPGLQVRLDEDDFAGVSNVYNFNSRAQTHSYILRHIGVSDEVSCTFAAAQGVVACHPDNNRSGKRISAEVICLGTGKLPSRFRSVISTLLLTPDGHILLDCGEGTIQQLERREGRAYWIILRDIKSIFISHAHADHHLGLIGLLRRRKRLDYPPSHPLYIVATRVVHRFLKEYQDLEDIGLCDDPAQNGVIQIVADALNYRHAEYPKTGVWRMLGTEPWLDLQLSRQHNLDMCDHLNLAAFETIDVQHRTRAFGTLITHNEGWSVTYSGDTMPSMNLVRLGIGTNLLIHEASHRFGEEKQASARGHSTIGQAILVGRDMFARNVLLTHLPSATVSLPPVQIAQTNENTDRWPGPVIGVATDLMGIDLDKFWKANIYASAIGHCHRIAAVIERKSVAQLLWDLLPEESLVCCPDIDYWPPNRVYVPESDHALRDHVFRHRPETRVYVKKLSRSPMR